MNDYSSFHKNRINLMIHIVAIPIFVVSFLYLVWTLLTFQILSTGIAFAGILLSFILQIVGHYREPNPPRPFLGPGDFFKRIITEQFVTFPIFVWTGLWWKNLRQ